MSKPLTGKAWMDAETERMRKGMAESEARRVAAELAAKRAKAEAELEVARREIRAKWRLPDDTK